ncbi:MAG: acyl-CoA/acyl-ACP dehydrogenase [Deltaproteobacteria bacterium]|nr:acyl-CoA/acyl-ACP dehydrogenase [Deltaproteobacteria bacterium]
MTTIGTDEIKTIRQIVADFAKREIRPAALESDRYPFAAFNHPLMQKLAENGFLRPTLTEEASGAGMRMLGAVLEEIAREDASIALIILIQSIAAQLRMESGETTGIRQGFVESTGGGETLVALPVYADPVERPDSVKAATQGNGFILNGSVSYIPCLPVADEVIIPVVMQNGKGIRLFRVLCKAAGVTIGDPIVSLGLRACPIADLTLHHVSMPADAVIGNNDGIKHYEGLCERFRGPLTAIALGILKGACAAARRYAEERYQGKKQIIDHDMVRMMLSNMIAWIDMGTVAVNEACRLADEKEPCPPSALLSIQTLASTAVTRATADGVQVLGGYGYMHEYGQEKRMRDAKQLQAVFGSVPVKRLEILKRNP